MNFFEHQDRARRNTRRLVVLFVLAVVAIVVAVHLAVVTFLVTSDAGGLVAGGGFFHPGIFLPVTAGTLFVIGGGSLYKTWQLSEGGSAVGRMLGGRPLDPNTSELEERRVLNVVEEMAIASGTPVPDVYLLDDERSINAFAAGRTLDDAVVGITRGTARLLSRDELQGVVAHEFSHILNGDMRLNLRLMGVIHGILVISMIGYLILRSGGGRSSARRKKGGGGAIVLLGLALYLIGWIGVFFGRLIKAGVSRQREFLADAAAVQFTRDPGGIGGALKKIGGYGGGSRIGHRRAEEASHLFFSDGLKKTFLGLTATHPPLAERIRRVDPSFDGTFPEVRWAEELAEQPPAAAAAFAGKTPRPGRLGPELAPAQGRGLSSSAPPTGAGRGRDEYRTSQLADEITRSVGTLDPEHIAWASAFLAELPEDLREAAREPAAARALAYGLLLDRDPEVRRRQLRILGETAEPAVVLEARRLLPRIESIGREARLPLVELALPALRRLSRDQYRRFRETARSLAQADGRVSLFEYALHRMLLRHLDPHFGKPRRRSVQYYSLGRLGTDCSCLLSSLARAGHPEEEASEAVAAGARELAGQRVEPELLPREACTLGDLHRALDRLALAAPRLKGKVLRAAVATAAHDHELTAAEAELLRAVADGLDCPVPPFLSAGEPGGPKSEAG